MLRSLFLRPVAPGRRNFFCGIASLSLAHKPSHLLKARRNSEKHGYGTGNPSKSPVFSPRRSASGGRSSRSPDCPAPRTGDGSSRGLNLLQGNEFSAFRHTGPAVGRYIEHPQARPLPETLTQPARCLSRSTSRHTRIKLFRLIFARSKMAGRSQPEPATHANCPSPVRSHPCGKHHPVRAVLPRPRSENAMPRKARAPVAPDRAKRAETGAVRRRAISFTSLTIYAVVNLVNTHLLLLRCLHE